MTLDRHNLLKLSLSSAAFLGAIAMATGCSTAPAIAPLVAATPATTSPIVLAAPAPAQPVDLYGEFPSTPRDPAPHVGTSGAFQQHTSAPDGRDAEVAVDPTGKLLAFASTRHSDHPDIYLQKVDGVSVVQLTDDPADDAFPSFSPDGQHIAFSSTRNGNWDIYTMDTDGRHVVQVTNGPAQDLHPTFSPDGTHLAYCSMGSRSDNWELWVVDLTSGAKRMIGYGLFPVWSPDKSADRIAFQRASQRGGRMFTLWTLELIDGEARRITEVASSSDAAIVSPTWSPDGQRLAYATIRPNATNAKESKEIWSISADGTNRQRLTDGIGANFSPAWAVDNRVYFVSDRSGAESIWSVHADPVQPIRPAVANAEPKHATEAEAAGIAEANAQSEHAAGGAAAPTPVTQLEDAKPEKPAAEATPAEKPVAVTPPAIHQQPKAEAPAAPAAPVAATDTHEVAGHH